MNQVEATEVADARLADLRKLPYEALVDTWLNQPRSEFARSRSGRQYTVEIEAVWDGEPRRELRVWVMVDSGGSSARRPLLRAFVIRPDGSFVDEIGG